MKTFLEKALAKKSKEKKVIALDTKDEDIGNLEFTRVDNVKYLNFMDSVSSKKDEDTNMNDIYRASNELLYNSCGEFKNKELQNAFDIKDPYDTPGKILGIIPVIELASDVFNKFNGVKVKEEIKEDIKN